MVAGITIDILIKFKYCNKLLNLSGLYPFDRNFLLALTLRVDESLIEIPAQQRVGKITKKLL